jgi:hypothetical protein
MMQGAASSCRRRRRFAVGELDEHPVAMQIRRIYSVILTLLIPVAEAKAVPCCSRCTGTTPAVP